MDFLGGSGVGFRRDLRTHSEKELLAGACGDCLFDSQADSQRDLKVESQRELREESQEDLQRGFRGDFEGELWERRLETIHRRRAPRLGENW